MFAECYFVRYSRTGERVIPTERFRKAYNQINKSENVRKVGQVL